MRTLGRLLKPSWRLFLFQKHVGLFGIFGSAVASISIFNLMQQYFEFGISPVIASMLNAYYWIFHDLVFGFFGKVLNHQFTQFETDSIVLWFIMASVCFRCLKFWFSLLNAHRENKVRAGKVELWLFRRPKLQFHMIASVFSLTIWPILFARFLYSRPISVGVRDEWLRGKYNDEYDMHHGMDLHMDFHVVANVRLGYRTVLIVQLTIVSIFLVAILAINAGLPPPR